MEGDLQLLIRRNVDGFEGYTLASQHVRNDNFKNFLKTYAQQRHAFAKEIKKLLNEKHHTVGETASGLGDLHQIFVNMEKVTDSMNDENILKECARGESQAISDYQDSIRSNKFSAAIQHVLIKQRDKIMAAERTMRELGPIVES